jgi:RNA polymerase sigma factor for flagellar operon FliA
MATSPVSNISNLPQAGLVAPFLLERMQSRKPAPTAPIAAAVDEIFTEREAERERVLLGNLPLVRFVARSIHERLPQHVEMEDLVSAGIVGLIDAFNKFDAGKNIQFRSYAQFRIRGAILDSLRSMDWGSRELRRKARGVENAVQKLTSRLKRKPLESEIAAELEIPLSAYQGLLAKLRQLEIGSLQELHTEGSPEDELAYLPTAPEEDPLYRCLQAEVSTQLSVAIAELPQREARVLALYYVEEMTLKEIGVVLGLVESRVSQIRAAAVRTLRTRLAGNAGNEKLRADIRRRHAMLPGAVVRKNAMLGSKAVQGAAWAR